MDEASPIKAGVFDRGRRGVLVLPAEPVDRLLDLVRFLERHPEPPMLLSLDGERVPLPTEVNEVLRRTVEILHQGQAAVVAAQAMSLTRHEAAEFLAIDLSVLVEMLVDGVIPFEDRTGRHRVKLRDLIAFDAATRAERRAILDQMVEEACDLGLYDDPPDSDIGNA